MPKLGPTAMPAENRDGRREVISKPGKDGKQPGLRPGVTARGEDENGEGRREAFRSRGRTGKPRSKPGAGGERPAKADDEQYRSPGLGRRRTVRSPPRPGINGGSPGRNRGRTRSAVGAGDGQRKPRSRPGRMARGLSRMGTDGKSPVEAGDGRREACRDRG